MDEIFDLFYFMFFKYILSRILSEIVKTIGALEPKLFIMILASR